MKKISRRNFLLASGAVTISCCPDCMWRFFFQHGSRFQCCSRFFRGCFRGSCRRRQGPEHLVLER